jgi:hypothetical protein
VLTQKIINNNNLQNAQIATNRKNTYYYVSIFFTLTLFIIDSRIRILLFRLLYYILYYYIIYHYIIIICFFDYDDDGFVFCCCVNHYVHDTLVTVKSGKYDLSYLILLTNIYNKILLYNNSNSVIYCFQ